MAVARKGALQANVLRAHCTSLMRAGCGRRCGRAWAAAVMGRCA